MPDRADAIADTIRQPGWFEVTRDDGSTYLVRLGQDDAGKLICTGVVVDGVITARGLRDLRLAEVMTGFVEWRDHAARTRGSDPLAAVELTDATPARPGPKGYSIEWFKRLEADYRRVVKEHPRSPVKALAAERAAPEVTVRRWLQVAQREHGLIPERSVEPGAPKKAARPTKKGGTR